MTSGRRAAFVLAVVALVAVSFVAGMHAHTSLRDPAGIVSLVAMLVVAFVVLAFSW